jgi:hypothetical protein
MRLSVIEALLWSSPLIAVTMVVVLALLGA